MITLEWELKEAAKARKINLSALFNEHLKAFLEVEGNTTDKTKILKKKLKVQRQIDTQLKNVSKLKVELNHADSQLQTIYEIENKEEEQKLRENEINFFKEAKEILDKDWNFLKGQINRYNNFFHKDISKETFLEKFKQIVEMEKKSG